MMTFAAAAATSACGGVSPRFVYRLGNSLYVPLTSFSNSLTLPELRGKGFVLPTPVVAALSRVRAVERKGSDQYVYEWKETGKPKIYYHEVDGVGEFPPKMKLPPHHHWQPGDESRGTYLPYSSRDRRWEWEFPDPEAEPKLDDLLREIQDALKDATTKGSETSSSKKPIESIVIAGEGEPTLRLDDMIELVKGIKAITDTLPTKDSNQASPSIRLTTNGLPLCCYKILPQILWNFGVSRISVGLMTWNADQYNELVKPMILTPNPPPEEGFERMCTFIRQAVKVDGDLEVEATAVDRPDVDKAKTEALAKSLGVTIPVRWRPYFP
jgi:hypothetical protein